MKTVHHRIVGDARKMTDIESTSVDLIVTSPPYPMIEMWDKLFITLNSQIRNDLVKKRPESMFEAMHRELDQVWEACFRVLKPNRFLCVNIGDATRTIKGDFRLYANHSRILSCLIRLGFHVLPAIIWRKQTNAPNKFMGSGMLPAGAYVTLEHEYILIARKGGKREFTTVKAKSERQQSAIFWEERNTFFSDVWMDLKGVRQALGDGDARKRSAAFPFELAYRLINMYSVKGDTVLDPFWGTGTTSIAAMAAARNSMGCEIDPDLDNVFSSNPRQWVSFANDTISQRLDRHNLFLEARLEGGKPMKHMNSHYNFPVVTAQEKNLLINPVSTIKKKETDCLIATYKDGPEPSQIHGNDWGAALEQMRQSSAKPRKKRASKKQSGLTQLELF